MNPYTRSRGLSFLLFTCLIMAVMLAALPALADLADTNAIAGTNSTGGINATQSDSASKAVNDIILLLIAAVTPIIVRGAKLVFPKIPSQYLPIIGPVLVWLTNLISTYAGGPHINPLLAALLGAAGTGLREVKEFFVPTVKAAATTTLPAIILVGFLSFGAMTALTGCKTPHLEAGGAYAPTNSAGAVIYNDLGLYLADANYKFIYQSVQSVFKFERDNRKAIWLLTPEVKGALDKIRPQAKDINRRWAEARKLYKANPTPAGLSTLQDIMNTMQRILDVAQQQIATVPAAVGKPTKVSP